MFLPFDLPPVVFPGCLVVGLLELLEWWYPPRYGPEWGSGGIFGLKYYRGTLYYTLAFEAEARFLREDGVKVYEFEQVGPLPTSGGDTYNAVDAVDDEIFFGGWVHAPARYMGRSQGRRARISFVNKYSHVHKYNINDDRVELLWRDSIHDEELWAGEVSEIVYDPVNDRLLLARGDGHKNLGVYQLERRGGEAKRLSSRPAYKGAVFYDHVCFDVTDNWVQGVNGVQCVDMVEDKVRILELENSPDRSVDGFPPFYPIVGAAAQSHGRFFLFVRGGVFVGNPLDENVEKIGFVRLFDFGESFYAPRRTMAKSVAGGLLVAFNAYSETLLYPENQLEERFARASNTIVGPSVLVYIAPPMARIVAAFGARVTGFEVVEGKLLIAANNMANTSRHDALPIDAGYRSFTLLSMDSLVNPPPPISFRVYGWQVRTLVFGGIPLWGYREPQLVVKASKDNRLTVYTYTLSLPLQDAEHDTYSIHHGRNVLDLRAYRNSIVAFRLEEDDEKAIIRIDLA